MLGGSPIVVSDGPQRASIQFYVEISKESSIQLIVSLDAEAPYVRFDVKVNGYSNCCYDFYILLIIICIGIVLYCVCCSLIFICCSC